VRKTPSLSVASGHVEAAVEVRPELDAVLSRSSLGLRDIRHFDAVFYSLLYSKRRIAESVAATAALAILGAVLASCTVWIALTNPGLPRPGLNAVINFVTVASLFGIGLYAWRREPANRFGKLMLLSGAGCFLAALSTSGQSVHYSVGRVSFWLVQPLLILLFLAYPAGVLTGRVEKVLVAVSVIGVAVLYLPTALVVQDFPLLPAYCSNTCPANAFRVVQSEPALVENLVLPARGAITVAVYATVAVLTFFRLRQSRLMFHGLVPVLAAVIFRSLALSAAVAAGVLGATAAQLEPFTWVARISTLVAAVGFLVGLLRWRVYAAAALEKLARESDEPTDPLNMRRRLSAALDDPSLELYFPDKASPSAWRDHTGQVARPLPADRRCVVEVGDGSPPLGLIVCDPALSYQRSVVEAAAGWLRGLLVRTNLRDALDEAIHSVEMSRRRLAGAAAMERRRIERDIHDGAQQQLVILRLKMALAAEQLRVHPERGADVLAALAPWVDSTIEEVRSLAHGIYPALLADAGLAAALRSIARSNPTPTTVHAEELGRYPLETESAVYFCCLEAIQNATKHANASEVVVSLSHENGELRFEVSDDGRGFFPDQVRDSVGLSNMRDRAAAFGGSLTVTSSPGEGTLVCASIPVNAR
jgi:signal transduction histidine kinase